MTTLHFYIAALGLALLAALLVAHGRRRPAFSEGAPADTAERAAEAPSAFFAAASPPGGRLPVETVNWQRAIIDNSISWISSLDLGYSVVYCNPSLCELIGWHEGDDRTCFDFLSPESQHRFRVQSMSAMEQGISWTGDLELISCTGEYIPVEASVYPIYDENKAKMGLAVSMNDARQKLALEKNAQEQLRSQEFISNFSMPFTKPHAIKPLMADALSYLESFMDTDRICVYTLNAAKTEVRCEYERVRDPGYASAIGYTQRMSDIAGMLEAQRGKPYLFFRDTSELYKQYPQIDFGAKSTLYVPIATDGEVLGYILYITIDKVATWSDSECRLAVLAASIIAGALAIEEREKQLIVERNRAQNASNAKSQFLSNMSHEIRTPMNAIIGMSQIAKETSDIDSMRSCMEMIEKSSEQLLSIINDILDISKIEDGRFELSSSVFSIERMLMNTCSLITDKADSARLSLSVELGESLAERYSGDEVRVEQIITNLLSNAVKFTPNGGSICVSADEYERRNGQAVIRISVRDTGIGMTEEQITRVFNSFEQADGGITRRFGGTGLGLPICKNLAEKMGGGISVESEYGKGSTFTAEICLEPVLEVTRGIDGSIADKLARLRVLIITDDEKTLGPFAKLTARYQFGHEIARCCDDASAAIKKCAAEGGRYDVILFDHALNGLKAVSVLDDVADIIDKESLVLITDFGVWNRIQPSALKYGVSKNISKPLFASSIFDAIVSVVGMGIFEEDGSDEDEIPDFSGLRLLLAEDIEINREIFIALLEKTGVEIDTAENGLIVVEKYRNDPTGYDAIIMDIQMPELNGLDATSAIRAMPVEGGWEIPIIAMTANAFREDVEACLAAGMNDHLAKPIDQHAVIDKIKQYTLDWKR